MDYSEVPYRELKKECAKRGLGGAGKRLELVSKLKDHDADQLKSTRQPLVAEKPPVMRTDTPPAQPPSWGEPEPDAKPKRPVFANYDENGRWVRRPKGFISWAEEERKWEQEYGRNHD